MSTDGWVGSWRPHRPRGPIAAQYRTPGPKYGLPSNVGYQQHDPTRNRAPAYTFGLKAWLDPLNRTPGPKYLVRPGFTARGPDGIPAYTMCGRPRPDKANVNPGPAHYSPEHANKLAFPTAPIYSMRYRTRLPGAPETPGPGTYRLPAVVGPNLPTVPSAPNCSISGRIGDVFGNLNRSPGPSHYDPVKNDVYMTRAPQYTMPGRTALLQPALTPGPSDYFPQLGRRQGQTFGLKHSEYVAPVVMDVLD